jgi:hypothetical protein
MSGNPRSKGPRYYAEPRRWGPAGWWCCRGPMVAGTIPAIGQVAICRACGAVIQVDASHIVQTIKVGRPRRRNRSKVTA